MPAISVILSAFNAQDYLAEAIDSVLGQSFADFELIIIDDGSTDNTAAVIRRYAGNDHRIRAYSQTNSGLSAALNRAIELATGDYIARMDADDVCLAGRLESQYQFMRSQPAVGVCGTWVRLIGSHVGDIWRYPVTDSAIRSEMILNCPFAHPAVMLRADVLRSVGRYNSAFSIAQDYELWTRMPGEVCLANLADVLLLHRMHRDQLTSRGAIDGRSRRETELIHAALLGRLGIDPTPAELSLHGAISAWQFGSTKEFVTQVSDWLRKLLDANDAVGALSRKDLSQVLAERWRAACWAARGLGLWTWRSFRRSELGPSFSLQRGHGARLAVACLRHELLLRLHTGPVRSC